MGVRKFLSCEEARNRDMVEYLSHLGFEPVRVSGNNYWYRSPLRMEKTASFKVERNLNRWYDHGTGKGGNLIDFGLLYHNCTVVGFLEKLCADNFDLGEPPNAEKNDPQTSLKLLNIIPLHDPVLVQYLLSRRINLQVSKRYCREVLFTTRKATIKAIGFGNEKGGYELRNSWFKGSSSPKAITHVKNGKEKISVFEGFFDFLSLLTIDLPAPVDTDYLILNSVSFFEKSRPLMDQYRQIHLYLDHDKTGQFFTRHALSWAPGYVDQSNLYKGYKDLNDWIMHIGKAPPEASVP